MYRIFYSLSNKISLEGGSGMRKSRTKIRREDKGYKYILIILFIVVLPIISIIPGYLGSKYLIIPSFFSEENKSVNNDKVEMNSPKEPETQVQVEEKANNQKPAIGTVELKGIDFFSIQVGSLSTKENANELVKELNEIKMGSYIHQIDGFKVVTVSLMDRGQIETLIPTIKSSYEGAFVVSTSIANKEIEYNKEESEYVQLLNVSNNNLIDTFKTLSDATFNLENESNIEEYKAIISSSKTNITKIINDFDNVEPPDRFKQLHSLFISIINNTSKNIDLAIGESDENLLVTGKNLLNTSLYQYSKFAKNALKL